MIFFFYNLALLTSLVAGAPWWLWRMATTHKYREGLPERLGRVPKKLVRDASPAAERPLIWLHAVSVGEVMAVSRLVKTLDTELPGYLIAVSTATRTGQSLACERFGANRVFYCPLDLPWAVRAYLNVLQPRLLILAETEFWPNLLNGCFRRGIPVAVVNARISDRSWPRYHMLRSLWRLLLSRLSRVLAQSETDAERLCQIGCLPERVTVAGNLKFDVRAAEPRAPGDRSSSLGWKARAPGDGSSSLGWEEIDATRILRSQSNGRRFIVAGSTLEGEEAALLDAWLRLLAADPQLILVVAPRHPERFASIATLLEKSANPWVRRSSWFTQPAQPLRPGEIVLLDTIGELASVYSLATVAFVGGSLVPAGGHNPLEPAQFGVPIVMGPHYANFRAIVDDLLARNALRIAAKEELASALADLLRDRPAAEAMGARAKEVFDRQAGATDRCVAALRELLSPKSERERTP